MFISEMFTSEITFYRSCRLQLCSTSLKLWQKIQVISTWLSSVQSKVSFLAIQRFATNALTFAQSTLYFFIQSTFFLLNPGPFFVGLGIGMTSDRASAKIQRVANVVTHYLAKGSILKRVSIAVTLILLSIFSIPYSDIAISFSLAVHLGAYFHQTASKEDPNASKYPFILVTSEEALSRLSKNTSSDRIRIARFSDDFPYSSTSSGRSSLASSLNSSSLASSLIGSSPASPRNYCSDDVPPLISPIDNLPSIS